MITRQRLAYSLSICLAFFFSHPVAAASVPPIPQKAEHVRPPEVRFWTTDFISGKRFFAFDSQVVGGGYLAAGDTDGDGTDEIVVGSGLGQDAQVILFSADGVHLRTFFPYPKGFRGGVRVALGDLDADGRAEIITAPGPGIEPRIAIFTSQGSKLRDGLAYAHSFLGGVRVAVGDVDGDGIAEIVTAPGPGGGPHIRFFNSALENRGWDFFAFDREMTDGVTLAILGTPSGRSEVVLGVESWSAPIVRRFVFHSGWTAQREFYAFDVSSRSGVMLTAFDVNGDGSDEIAASPNGQTAPEVRFFDREGVLIRKGLLHDPTYRGALSLAQIHVASKEASQLMVMPVAPVVNGPLDQERLIDVSLKEQRLYAYERGRIARSFLVSTGVARHPTPIIKTTVQRKIPIKDYRWTYGPHHPENYFLRNVKFNLNVVGPYYIHAAYWHNNFGRPMSHGCVNLSLPNAEWLYNWAATGTPVDIHL